MAKLGILKEFWDFVKHHKKFWLIPIVLLLLIIGLLLFITEGSAIAPFIYALF
jgi:competence protein ComGC